MDAINAILQAAQDLAEAGLNLAPGEEVRRRYKFLELVIHNAADEVVDRLKEPLVVNLPLVIPPAPADLGRFELSAYELGITRHEVAAAALDRVMARDFSLFPGMKPNADHPRLAALEAWAYANSLFEVEHATEEQPS